MEARIARIESDVAHLLTHVADIKVDVRSLRDKTDGMAERFDTKFDALRKSIDGTKDSVGEVKDGLRAGMGEVRNDLSASITEAEGGPRREDHRSEG